SVVDRESVTLFLPGGAALTGPTCAIGSLFLWERVRVRAPKIPHNIAATPGRCATNISLLARSSPAASANRFRVGSSAACFYPDALKSAAAECHCPRLHAPSLPGNPPGRCAPQCAASRYVD